MPVPRRTFLRHVACSTVGYSLVNTIFDLYKMNAVVAQTGDYKALVCVFLFGGNDSNNMLMPRAGADYTLYAQGRGNLAIPAASMLPITPTGPSDGRAYGLHPSMVGIQGLFGAGKAAFLRNVGPLVGPTTKAQYQSNSSLRPKSLFSHSDQQQLWQTSIADQVGGTGWGGRLGDIVRSLNTNDSVSMAITVAGQNTFQVGSIVTPYQVSPGGGTGFDGYIPVGTARDYERAETTAINQIIAREHTNLFENAYKTRMKSVIDNAQTISQAINGQGQMQTVFPQTGLGQELRTIAQLIASRNQFGHRRQIFFCSTGGYDTHSQQLGAHAGLLAGVSAAMTAFYNATVELGVANQVTAFTASDFNRTFASNGDGSDHAWGGHQLMVGGAVKGGALYGSYPNMIVNGSDDSGEGRWIPTTAVDQYASTLATWFGVSAAQLPTIFPNIGRFATSNLGFML